MASQVDIINLALQRAGKANITATTNNNENTRQCLTCWDATLSEVLSRSNWTFAITTATLALIANTPLVDFTYQYQLPTDYVKTVDLYDSNKNVIDKEYYQVTSRYIETDYESVILKYVYIETNTVYYSPLFIKALYLKLAHSISNTLTSNTGLQDRLLVEYEDALKDAILADNKNRKKTAGKQSGSWISARY